MIIDALKKRLYTENDREPGRWMKELPAVVWGLRTQASRNTGVSPYFMVYGSEAVLPSDVTFGSPRFENFDQSTADIARELEINCMEERRLTSCLQTAKYLEAIRRYHNRNVKTVPSWSVIWYSSGKQARKERTIYPHLGKVPLWSSKSHVLHHTDWRIQMEHACLILGI